MSSPFFRSAKGYNKNSFKNDIIAGLVVTAIAIPEAMGIATLAGVPVQMGLYSLVFAPLAFALFGASRRLVVGADSATAVLIASGATALAVVGSAGYTNIVLVLGLMSAAMLALMVVFKLTFLSDLISRPVMVGFLAGVGVQLMSIKLPEMLGLRVQGSPLYVVAHTFTLFDHVNGLAVSVAVFMVGAMVLFRQSRVPGALVSLLGSAAVAYFFGIAGKGVAMVGGLPVGLPTFMVPSVPANVFVPLLPVAASMALVIVAQSTAVIRGDAAEHDEQTDITRDMAALSIAGVVSSLTHGLAINGSPPRTAAADISGMRSQVAGVVMAVATGLLLVIAGGIFAYVPVASLAAIVFIMGFHLIRVRELWYLARHELAEFTIALLALLGVLFFGVFSGIVIAVTASLIERLRREYHPSDGILLRDGHLSTWAAERAVGLQPIPDDMLVFGFDASLFFENVHYFSQRLRRAIRGAKKPLRRVIIDTSAMDDIDYTAVEHLKEVYRHLSLDGIRLGFSHVSPHLMRQFESYGVVDLVGREHMFPTLRSALEYTPRKAQTVSERVEALKLSQDSYVVVGGAVMDALNLRESATIDIVVSGDVFARFATQRGWSALSHGTNKTIYTKNGIGIMRSWAGRSLGTIRRGGTFTKDGVTYMGIPQLIACKQHLGRRKDQSDITLLHAQLTRERMHA